MSLVEAAGAASAAPAGEERLSRARLIRRRFLRNRLALFGAGTIVVMFFFAFVSPYFAPWNYYENDFTAWNDHPFRVRADVVRALKTALRVCGAHKRRGGWVVSR